MLNQPWTLEDLEANNILVEERTSLKDVILNMEDLVLANAGVDAFEEVFKLIYAKLFDEARAARARKGQRNLDFRVGGRTAKEFADVVNALFQKAMQEWPGVFSPGERINLENDHLKVCGSALERVKLFNSNLSVIAEAFEYLSIKASKGEKKYFETVRPTSVIKRFASTEEVANLVAYLCSPLALATTGAALRVDGGVVRTCF